MSNHVTCCPNKCFRKLSIEDIKYCEKSLKSQKQTARRNSLLDYLHKHSKIAVIGGIETQFIIGGRAVCKRAWLLAHDIKPETFRRIYSDFQKGIVQVEHGNLGNKRPSQKTKECIAWLEFFVSCVGQYQPDQTTVHLPSCYTLSSIYQQMVEENNSFGVESVSQSQFYHIFHTYLKHVSLPKVSTAEVVKCNVELVCLVMFSLFTCKGGISQTYCFSEQY